MFHFRCSTCEKRGRQTVAATPTAAFRALATQIPSAHLFAQAQIKHKHTQPLNTINALSY